MAKDNHWKDVRARAAVIRDLIRKQNAPVPESEMTDLQREVTAEVVSYGLPESDAAWFYKKMQLEGWKFHGIPVEDWHFTIASIHRHKFFPSQRRA